MKAEAIVYTSNTGYTEQYARLLGGRTGLPVCGLKEAKTLPEKTAVIYLGWLMAGTVKGYRKAAGRFAVTCVVGVGMGAAGSQTGDVRKNNAIPDGTPVYTLQGGFDITKLHGIYKFMMTVMARTAGKGLAEKKDRTPDEDAMLDMLFHGGSRVSEESLTPVLEWYGSVDA